MHRIPDSFPKNGVLFPGSAILFSFSSKKNSSFQCQDQNPIILQGMHKKCKGFQKAAAESKGEKGEQNRPLSFRGA